LVDRVVPEGRHPVGAGVEVAPADDVLGLEQFEQLVPGHAAGVGIHVHHQVLEVVVLPGRVFQQAQAGQAR